VTPRRRLRWAGADEFSTPRPGGLSLPEAARKIDSEFGLALTALRDEVASTYGIPPGLMPLAWFSDDGIAKCAPCSTEVEVGPLLLRCPDCGAVAAKPEGWMP